MYHMPLAHTDTLGTRNVEQEKKENSMKAAEDGVREDLMRQIRRRQGGRKCPRGGTVRTSWFISSVVPWNKEDASNHEVSFV
jgi:phenylpropionate dioxygenase-like ring-hydroxylating dioxygenase large terminal subunit